MKFLPWLLKHSQTLVESVAQDGDTFKEIGAAFQVKGDLKNALSSAFRLRDSRYDDLKKAECSETVTFFRVASGNRSIYVAISSSEDEYLQQE